MTVIGRSLGTGVAVRRASEQPASRLILATPYDSIVEIAAGQYPYVPVSWLLRDRYESWRYAPNVTVPSTLIEAEQVEVIPHASTERLFARFRQRVATLRLLRGFGHNGFVGRSEYGSALREALLKHANSAVRRP